MLNKDKKEQFAKEALKLLYPVKNEVDLNHKYQPSGLFTSKTIPIYLMFSIFASFVALIVITASNAIWGGLVGILWRYWGFIKWMVIILVLIIGYGFSGKLLAKIVDLGAKPSANRNKIISILFTFISVIITFLGLFYLTMFLSTKFNIGYKMNNIWDRTTESWIITGIGFFILLISSYVFSSENVENNPYCEKCHLYFQKKHGFFQHNSILKIVETLKSFRNNDYKEFDSKDITESSGNHPNVEIIKYECDSCHDGYINVIWNYYIFDENNKVKKETLFVYSDHVANQSISKVNII